MAEWASIDIDALVSALAPLEVESGVDVEKRNEVVYLQVVVFESVSMEVDPNNVLQTSPARFDEVENIFISR